MVKKTDLRYTCEKGYAGPFLYICRFATKKIQEKMLQLKEKSIYVLV
ncbi:hypothetical protein [Mediterraneibacter massiliensis]|nr:hypothetical protein [Mediterraneibacter massiliensis]